MNIQETIEKIKRQILIGECEKSIGIPVYISDLKTVLAELDKKDKIIKNAKKWIDTTMSDGNITGCNLGDLQLLLDILEED